MRDPISSETSFAIMFTSHFHDLYPYAVRHIFSEYKSAAGMRGLRTGLSSQTFMHGTFRDFPVLVDHRGVPLQTVPSLKCHHTFLRSTASQPSHLVFNLSVSICKDRGVK